MDEYCHMPKTLTPSNPKLGEMDEYGPGPDASDLLPQRLVSEALGTFFLVLTVGLNVLQVMSPPKTETRPSIRHPRP